MGGQFRNQIILWLLSVVTVMVFALGKGVELPIQDADSSSIKKLQGVLHDAADLPIWSQKVVLRTFGEAFVKNGITQCNVFGGPGACITVSEGSRYREFCKSANTEVDCAFEMEVLEEVSSDPDSIMQHRFAGEGYEPCASCYASLQRFWCAQTVPTCGTFDKVLDEILPVISSTILKKGSAAITLQKAMPRILRAASLGLPCKEMCQAIIGSCSCGQIFSIGEVIVLLQSKGTGASYSMNMSASTARQLFRKVWNMPVCDIFSEEKTPGFSGVCEVSEESSSCEWCKQKRKPGPASFMQIVAQISQLVSGMMQGGLEEVLILASKEKKQKPFWSWNQDLYLSKEQGGGHVGAGVVLTLFVIFAIVAFTAAIKYNRNRPIPSQYIDLNSMGYTPPIL
eukprot:c13235_g1_i1 orf=338-1528(-)